MSYCKRVLRPFILLKLQAPFKPISTAVPVGSTVGLGMGNDGLGMGNDGLGMGNDDSKFKKILSEN